MTNKTKIDWNDLFLKNMTPAQAARDHKLNINYARKKLLAAQVLYNQQIKIRLQAKEMALSQVSHTTEFSNWPTTFSEIAETQYVDPTQITNKIKNAIIDKLPQSIVVAYD